MLPSHTFTATTEDALWQQVAADIRRDPDLFEYSAELVQDHLPVRLDIDIDLGGGFESGFASTSFTAPVPASVPLRFALHEQDWLHEVGKLLGLTDVELNDPELDAAFIITTNDAEALRILLLDTADVRATLLRYQECRLTLGPASHAPDAPLQLVFTKEDALVEPEQLREVYHMLYALLRRLTGPAA
ncbi:hypothetical protein LJ737_12150 [Hymenobacter sp. 15J16-1T3B]|uniref:hypothetical protein n=1 Tax=Hymenobacter sp. 15J16-1T3B TaxID=2886941 RepID=UPI001D1119C1|nr:hypothetical protein [Hymenobacter sp. 15J16-1T3B]MCC3157994.1 hypothetical protein [Hymenobacter sp. 15J16-1T3B]